MSRSRVGRRGVASEREPAVPMRESGGSPVSLNGHDFGASQRRDRRVLVSLRIDPPGACPELHYVHGKTDPCLGNGKGAGLSPHCRLFASASSPLPASPSMFGSDGRVGTFFARAAARMPSQAALGLSWTGIRRPIGDPIEWLRGSQGGRWRLRRPICGFLGGGDHRVEGRSINTRAFPSA